MAITGDSSVLRQILQDHIGEEVTLYLRDYTMIDGTHARSVTRQGVVYKVGEDDVALLTVSQYSREATVHAIKLDYIMEMQGRKLSSETIEWFSSIDASRRLQWLAPEET